MPRILPFLLILMLGSGLAIAEFGYVGCSTPDTAHSFDLTTHTVGPVIDLLPEGNYPYDATIKPDGLEVWIPGASGDGVTVISRVTNLIIAQIPTGDYPVSVAFNGDGTLALVSCRSGGRIDLINTNTYTLFGSLPIQSDYLGPGNIAFDPLSENFYVVDWYGDSIYEIAPDGLSVLREVNLGSSLWQLTVETNPGHNLYVTDRGTDQVRVVDPVTLMETATVGVGDDPWGIDINAEGTRVVVACEDSHNVHVIELPAMNTVVVPLAADADPRDVDIHDGFGLAYVPSGSIAGTDFVYTISMDNYGVGNISIPSANPNVVAVQAQAGSDPTGVAEAPAARSLLTLHPNPFNPTTSARFSLSDAAGVRLDVFALDGRLIRTLLGGAALPRGDHAIDWDGRDQAGRALPSGVYLMQLQTGRSSEVIKATLLK